MKTMNPFTKISCLIAVLALGLSAVAQEKGFVPLFNGKDLTGWSPSKENPDSYSVNKDGELVVKGGSQSPVLHG